MKTANNIAAACFLIGIFYFILLLLGDKSAGTGASVYNAATLIIVAIKSAISELKNDRP